MHKILTFNIPNTSAQWICGANGTNYLIGEYKTAGLPNITGEFSIADNVVVNNQATQPKVRSGSGAFSILSSKRNTCYTPATTDQADYNNGISFSAASSNSIYGNSITVRPRSVVINFCIKF